jgi:hypothetical protein
MLFAKADGSKNKTVRKKSNVRIKIFGIIKRSLSFRVIVTLTARNNDASYK